MSIRVKNAKKIKAFIPFIFKRERVRLAQIKYVFCNDSFLLDINRRFLGHDYYTDIITFPLSDKGQPVQGEIYISSPMVKENAKKYKTTIETEFLRIIIHGALHLCDFKDTTINEKKLMTAKEEEYLLKYKKQFF